MPDSTLPGAADLLARNADLEKENALLRQKIDSLVRKLFGTASEKLDPAQLSLLSEVSERLDYEPARFLRLRLSGEDASAPVDLLGGHVRGVCLSGSGFVKEFVIRSALGVLLAGNDRSMFVR